MKDYADLLREEFDGYDGLYADELLWVPRLFDYLTALVEDRRLPRSARELINAALAYFVLPYDVMPETALGAFGFMDDLYLCADVLRRLLNRAQLGEVLAEHWDHEPPLHELVDRLLRASHQVLGADERAQVLALAGLDDDVWGLPPHTGERWMQSYCDQLRQELADYQGLYRDLVQWVPVFFDFFTALVEDERFPRAGRIAVNAVLAYFVLPFDALPESGMGGFGFLDDLYLCAHVAHQLQCDPELSDLLDEHWPHERPLAAVIGDALAQTGQALSAADRELTLFIAGLGDRRSADGR
ncbi:MAG: DUF1232 domain-containing protein [Deltaproteobacteria bacterium]|nr:DUF1232 domain-containing protein [Deltaproteobacteria bacterium]